MSLPPEPETTSTPAAARTRTSDRHTDVAVPIVPGVDELTGSASRTEDPLVPARSHSADRMISGFDLIDFGVGGLLPHKVYVVKGGSGVGKSVAGLQFLTRGLEHHEPGVLITDQKPANVLSQARSIGFTIEEAVRRNQLSILNPSSRYFDLVESPADIQAIVDELADYIRQIDARRLVIDPIYTLINTQYSANFALMVTQSLLNALEELPVTTLLIAGDEDNAEVNPIIRMLEHNAFGVVSLTNDEATGGRLMRLSKLGYANSDDLSAHYRILNGRGLINYRGEGEQVTDITQPWEETATLNRNVLLVGANPETIRRVKTALGDQYHLRAESDLAKGIERVRQEKPGLVLITPSRSIAAAGAIVDLARNSSSAIAFLSPETNRKSDKVLYLRAGADDFISEPFSPDEFKARVEALIRRSGRRLTTRDSGVNSITSAELASLMNSGEEHRERIDRPIMTANGDDIAFDPDFNERLQRNIDAVSRLDTPFALYWIKSHDEDPELSQELAKICRQEDILCHSRAGEFVAILTGTDQHGVRGFENRLDSRLGDRVSREHVLRGYELYQPGQQRGQA